MYSQPHLGGGASSATGTGAGQAGRRAIVEYIDDVQLPMGEAIAIVGAVASVLQLAEFTIKAVKATSDLLYKEENALFDNGTTERLAREYEALGAMSATRPSKCIQTTADENILRLGSICQKEAQELVDQLEALTLHGGDRGITRLGQAVQKVIKILRQKRKIEKSRSRLHEANGLLSTAILQSLYAKQALYTTPGADLVQAVRGTVGSDDDRLLILAHKQRILKDRTENIIQSLSFPDQSARRDGILGAYSGTYEWALDNDTVPLKPWLRSKEGIFWISGKAGSGKSTLMKLLSDHAGTRKLLNKWCAGKTLILASFFFWYAGSPLQRSTSGLLRSILHEILATNQEWTQIAFPTLFEGGYAPHIVRWTKAELIKGLKTLALHRNKNGNRFAFFIDGLDEYHGDDQDNGNLLEIVSLLKQLAQNADIKICVSSRPWNTFRVAFESSVPHLKVEDLSRPDILLYVDGRIRESVSQCLAGGLRAANEWETSLLITEIVNKAEGVFLWVMLVVKSVLRGFDDLDKISMLRQRVRSFPSDLEPFFQAMLDRVDGAYEYHTSQALKLACLYATENGSAKRLSNFLDFWMIQQDYQGLADPEFPIGMPITTVSPENLNEMFVETQIMLSAACKDLLCIPKNHGKGTKRMPKVEFLHRTVHDFLMTGNFQISLDKKVPDHFRDSHVFHLLNLARIKFKLPADGTATDPFQELDESARMSIETLHPFLTEKYVAAFEGLAIQAHDGRWIDRIHFLTTLVAFRTFDYALDCLEYYDEEFWQARFDDATQNSMLLAAFGSDPRNPYALRYVSIKLVERLMDLGLLKYDGVNDGGCSYNAWQLLLRKCFLDQSNPCRDTTSLDGSKITRREWQILKLFLNNHASIHESFCCNHVSPTAPGHEDKPCVASDFLKETVPEKWLLESESTAGLIDVKGDPEGEGTEQITYVDHPNKRRKGSR